MITISPGHWLPGTGAKSIIDEVTEARRVAKRVVEILRGMGVQTNYVEDNSSKNQQQNLTYLINEHNKTSRQIDVFIHFNSAAGGNRNEGIGTECFYKTEKTLAAQLASVMSSTTSLKNRGAKLRNDLAVLNSPLTKRAVLPEICFVNSVEDVKLYQANFEKLCQGLAKVLAEAVGHKIEDKTNNRIYELVEEKDSKVWRIQSGAYKTREDAIKAFNEQMNIKYATIKGTLK